MTGRTTIPRTPASRRPVARPDGRRVSGAPAYLTTAEAARLLRLNQKKLYALVAAGRLPATRVSGKWLFPRSLLERWLAEHTCYPQEGVLGALLDQVLITSGSDDPLFARLVQGAQATLGLALPTSSGGSLAGLAALTAQRAHLATFHLDANEARPALAAVRPAWTLTLFGRRQGLIYDRRRTPQLARGISHLRGLRLARRQPLAGTQRLLERLLVAARLSGADLLDGGRHDTHLELALAVRRGEADAGLGIELAAARCGLAFTPLVEEHWQLAIPGRWMVHRSVERLIGWFLDELRRLAASPPIGYQLALAGQLAGPPPGT